MVVEQLFYMCYFVRCTMSSHELYFQHGLNISSEKENLLNQTISKSRLFSKYKQHVGISMSPLKTTCLSSKMMLLLKTFWFMNLHLIPDRMFWQNPDNFLNIQLPFINCFQDFADISQQMKRFLALIDNQSEILGPLLD